MVENQLQVFTNSDFGEIRTVIINDEPYLVGKDVAEILGYANHSEALAKHVDDEDKLNSKTLSSFKMDLGQRGGWLINESGLYSLIFSSKLPTANDFKRWVTSEVLPSIRRTGSYDLRVSPTSAEIEVQMINAKVLLSNQFLKLADIETLSPEYKNILIAKAAEALTGTEIIPLPQSAQKMYSATEIGKMLGVSANKIGRLATKYNLKTKEYGAWFRDKSPYSSKEIDCFRYNNKAVEKFKAVLN